MNKPAHIGLSILEISDTVLYEFKFDYVKPKYRKKCHIMLQNIDSFKDYVKTVVIYVDIAKDFETQFDTSIYELNRPLPKGKIKM